MDTLLIAITGPTGAGKTTVGALLAQNIEQCAHIEVDVLKHMIVNGFVYNNTAKGQAQWEQLGVNVGFLAQNFIDAGYNVVITGYMDQAAWDSLNAFAVVTHGMMLLPNEAVNLSRDAARPTEQKMGKAAVLKHRQELTENEFFKPFAKIDNSDQSPEQTTEQIKKLLLKDLAEQLEA